MAVLNLSPDATICADFNLALDLGVRGSEVCGLTIAEQGVSFVVFYDSRGLFIKLAFRGRIVVYFSDVEQSL